MGLSAAICQAARPHQAGRPRPAPTTHGVLSKRGIVDAAQCWAPDAALPRRDPSRSRDAHHSVFALRVRTGGSCLDCPSLLHIGHPGRKIGCLTTLLFCACLPSIQQLQLHPATMRASLCLLAAAALLGGLPSDARHKLNTPAAAALCGPQLPARLPSASTAQAAVRCEVVLMRLSLPAAGQGACAGRTLHQAFASADASAQAYGAAAEVRRRGLRDATGGHFMGTVQEPELPSLSWVLPARYCLPACMLKRKARV